MKALISTTEVFTWTWASSWTWVPQPTQENPDAGKWQPVYSEIENCQRVAQVEPDDKTFEVHHTLIWVDCPDNCVADMWYYKDGQVQVKPQDVEKPQGE
jgi:hypothetical protein